MTVRIFLPLFLLTFLLSNNSALAAKASDADNIPHIDQQGKGAFREFLAAGKHRAFVIAPGGAWAWKANETTTDVAIENAILECQQGSEQPCVPYVVNDKIVFDAKRWPTLWGPYLKRMSSDKSHVGKERGDRFFDLSFKTPEGKNTSLAQLRGKVIVLHFWGTWCSSCRHEMPDLQKLNQQLSTSPDIQLVLLQVREEAHTSRKWAKQQNIMLPLYDSGITKAGSDLLKLSNSKTISDNRIAMVFPTTYILDKHGIVVFAHPGTINNWGEYLPFLRDVAAKSGK
ncbi:MAG: TlpA disulfide reductase family protein [Gallionellaceae bacterium]|nr:TlpA disulfide reductase family protein [Gallionellaceae bacterium]